MKAVIKTGGKQYLVKKGDILAIEKIDKRPKSMVDFKKVLLAFDAKGVKIGKPIIKSAKVKGEVMAQEKGKKITVIKYKPKTRYRRQKGHRQALTKVKITAIEA